MRDGNPATVEDIPWGDPPPEQVTVAKPRKCPHPRDRRDWTEGEPAPHCGVCGHRFDPAVLKRNRNNRKRGVRYESIIARRYGGEPVGALNLPEDIRGIEYRTQVKTHQGSAPAMWRKAFAALEAGRDARTPRLVVCYLAGPGVPADEYVVVRGRDWLERFGRDE